MLSLPTLPSPAQLHTQHTHTFMLQTPQEKHESFVVAESSHVMFQGVLRPDEAAYCGGLLLFAAEDKKAGLLHLATGNHEIKLGGKLLQPHFYGLVPFIPLMACAGAEVKFGSLSASGKV